MRIWIDADSCPRRVREIVAKAANRYALPAFFVANRHIPLPEGKSIRMIVVEEESADEHIKRRTLSEDLVITRDIPLAASLVEGGIVVLNDRGTVYTAENVRERLSIRDFMYGLRAQGVNVPESAHFDKRDVHHFAKSFDRELHRKLRRVARE